MNERNTSNSPRKLQTSNTQVNLPSRCQKPVIKREGEELDNPQARQLTQARQLPMVYSPFEQSLQSPSSFQGARSHLAIRGEDLLSRFNSSQLQEFQEKYLMKKLMKIKLKEMYQLDRFQSKMSPETQQPLEPSIVYSQPNEIVTLSSKKTSVLGDFPEQHINNQIDRQKFYGIAQNVAQPRVYKSDAALPIEARTTMKGSTSDFQPQPDEAFANSEKPFLTTKGGSQLKAIPIDHMDKVLTLKEPVAQPLPDSLNKFDSFELIQDNAEETKNTSYAFSKQNSLSEMKEAFPFESMCELWMQKIRKNSFSKISLLRDEKTLQEDCESFLNHLFNKVENIDISRLVYYMNQTFSKDIGFYINWKEDLPKMKVVNILEFLFTIFWSLFLESLGIKNNLTLSVLLAQNADDIETTQAQSIYQKIAHLSSTDNPFVASAIIGDIMKDIITNTQNISQLLFKLFIPGTYIELITIISAEVSPLIHFQGLSSLISLFLVWTTFDHIQIRSLLSNVVHDIENGQTTYNDNQLSRFSMLTRNNSMNVPLMLNRLSETVQLSWKKGDVELEKNVLKIRQLLSDKDKMQIDPYAFLLTPFKTFKFPNLLQTEKITAYCLEHPNIPQISRQHSSNLVGFLQVFLTSLPSLNNEFIESFSNVWFEITLRLSSPQEIHSLIKFVDNAKSVYSKETSFFEKIAGIIVLFKLVFSTFNSNTLRKTLWPDESEKNLQNDNITNSEWPKEYFFGCLCSQIESLDWTEGFYIINILLDDSACSKLFEYTETKVNTMSSISWSETLELWRQIRVDDLSFLPPELSTEKLSQEIIQFSQISEKSERNPDFTFPTNFQDLLKQYLDHQCRFKINLSKKSISSRPISSLLMHIWAFFLHFLNIEDEFNDLSFVLSQQISELPYLIKFTTLKEKNKHGIEFWEFVQMISNLFLNCVADLANVTRIIQEFFFNASDYFIFLSIVATNACSMISTDGLSCLFQIASVLTEEDLDIFIEQLMLDNAQTSELFKDLYLWRLKIKAKPSLFLNYTESGRFSLENLKTINCNLNLKSEPQMGVKDLIRIDLKISVKEKSQGYSSIELIFIEVLQFFLIEKVNFEVESANVLANAWYMSAKALQMVFLERFEYQLRKVQPLEYLRYTELINFTLTEIGFQTLLNVDTKSINQEIWNNVLGLIYFQMQSMKWSDGVYMLNNVLNNKKWQTVILDLVKTLPARPIILIEKQESPFYTCELQLTNNFIQYSIEQIKTWGSISFVPSLILLKANTARTYNVKLDELKAGIWFRIIDNNDEEIGFCSLTFYVHQSFNIRCEGSNLYQFTSNSSNNLKSFFPVKFEDAGQNVIKAIVGAHGYFLPALFPETHFSKTKIYVSIKNKTGMKIIVNGNFSSSTGTEDWYFSTVVLLKDTSRSLFFKGEDGKAGIYMEIYDDIVGITAGFSVLTFKLKNGKLTNAEGSNGSFFLKSQVKILPAGLKPYEANTLDTLGIDYLHCEVGLANEMSWDAKHDVSQVVNDETKLKNVRAVVQVTNKSGESVRYISSTSENNLPANKIWVNNPGISYSRSSHSATGFLQNMRQLLVLTSDIVKLLCINPGLTFEYEVKFECPQFWLSENHASGSCFTGLQSYSSRSSIPVLFEYNFGIPCKAGWQYSDIPDDSIDNLNIDLQSIYEESKDKTLISPSYKNDIVGYVRSGPNLGVDALQSFKSFIASATTRIDILTFSAIEYNIWKEITTRIRKQNKNSSMLTIRVYIGVFPTDKDKKVLTEKFWENKTARASVLTKILNDIERDLILEKSKETLQTLSFNPKSAVNTQVILGAGRPFLEIGTLLLSKQVLLTGWNHEKIIVVDGERVISGSMNFFSDNFISNKDATCDTSIKLNGDAARNAQNYIDIFWENLNSVTWQPKPVNIWGSPILTCEIEDYEKVRSFSIICTQILQKNAAAKGFSSKKQLINTFSPVWAVGRRATRAFGTEPSEKALLAMINNAKQEIILSQQALFYPTHDPPILAFAWPDLVESLCNCLVKGIKVKILLSRVQDLHGYGSTSALEVEIYFKREIMKSISGFTEDFPYYFGPISQLMQNLEVRNLSNGVSPLRNHNKIVIIDQKALYIGSHNLYPSSQSVVLKGYLNESYKLDFLKGDAPLGEFGFIILNKKEVSSFKQKYFDIDWENSKI